MLEEFGTCRGIGGRTIGGAEQVFEFGCIRMHMLAVEHVVVVVGSYRVAEEKTGVADGLVEAVAAAPVDLRPARWLRALRRGWSRADGGRDRRSAPPRRRADRACFV